MKPYSIFLIYFTVFLTESATEQWEGRWFPHDPLEPDTNPAADVATEHRPKMGVLNDCDDAKRKIEKDWNMDAETTLCLEDKMAYKPNASRYPIETISNIPSSYIAPHICMDKSIVYSTRLTTFGPHRPNWAKWGEYTFVPKQRYLHNLEHGGVVMLYHPCADKNEVNLLRNIIKNCLYRHVISTSKEVTPEYPLAVLTWGHSLEMSKVDENNVVQFIKNNALRGPERTPKDGYYTNGLLEKAVIVSNKHDAILCPSITE